MSVPEPAELLRRIDAHPVAAGSIAAWWLGGSGFLFKTSFGTKVLIDPYLSDSVKGIFDQGRAFPPPLDAAEVRPDLVVVTHWHEDHLDPGTIPSIARHSPATYFMMPPTAQSRALGWGVPRGRVSPIQSGQTLTASGVSVTAVPARHESTINGWETPDAVGVLIQCDGLTIYHTGDTEYDARLRLLADRRIGTMLICINGNGGNMNAHEAALLTWQLEPGVVVPMHHHLWAGSDDDAVRLPALFADTLGRLRSATRIVVPQLGMPIECT